MATSLVDLPLLQDTAEEDVWGNWDAVWRDVQVVDSEGEVTDVLNLTTNDLRTTENYDLLRGMIIDAATSKREAGSRHQNRIEPMDTTMDGFVAPNDVLAVINKINRDGAGELADPGSTDPTIAYDVTGDNWVSALDALRIIQVLNRVSSSGSGEPAGEAPDVVETAGAQALAADAVFASSISDSVADDDDESEV